MEIIICLFFKLKLYLLQKQFRIGVGKYLLNLWLILIESVEWSMSFILVVNLNEQINKCSKSCT